jgi:hypothetical protein
MSHLLIVRRVALTAIHIGQFFMLFFNRLLVTCQTVNLPVHGLRMIFRHFFMAFRALRSAIAILRIDVCDGHRGVPDENGKNYDLSNVCLHIQISKYGYGIISIGFT